MLTATTDAVRRAGALVLRRYSTESRPANRDEMVSAMDGNATAVADLLRPELEAINPDATWLDDEHGSGPLGPGEWWLIDPVGGNLNAVHGMTDWNIGVSLVRDGVPVLAVVYFPLLDEMFTAEKGGGTFLNGVPVRVSAKTSLDGAVTGTGQAKPGQSREVVAKIGDSFRAMLGHVIYVRVSVPVTHQLAQVAAGRMDLHWQFDNVRAHASGVLLVQEAGGVVTGLKGEPWDVTTTEYLAAAPGLHAAALDVLSPR
ncbi:myo-inositol-1(or 4)-monophosphatase [Lentzea fradiae]|uniref:Myo-inositol-1(Or 4)-monophosphatase n=1 Tax=Lentzea fradiae TaxID=200378 RepID=A0A1G7T6L9_9PSEU|nr:inositol monophosphatase family protein [Lentzea fradiae]SDG31017.1 myo-inositol-1(or 4)-monophosphatase [Lentzea fradiae]